MKLPMRLFIVLCFGFAVHLCAGQNVSINTIGNPPNASAMLDIDASPGNSKGLLIPRLTTG